MLKHLEKQVFSLIFFVLCIYTVNFFFLIVFIYHSKLFIEFSNIYSVVQKLSNKHKMQIFDQ